MDPLLSVAIRPPGPESTALVDFAIVYSELQPAAVSQDLSERLQAKDEELSARLQDVEVLKKRLEEMKILSDLESQHELLKSTHLRLVSDLESANSSLRGDIYRLETDLQSKEDQVRKLAALIKERDSRKKNAEKLLDQVEKRNKELVEDHVRKELEIEELKRKCAEYLADLQRFKEDLVHQDELRKKREDQVTALLSQLKRREQENARLSKELKRREEENKELNASIQTLTAKVEKETRLKLQRELDQVRGLAAAKEGEMRVVKEMIKSYHHQLKQKEVEVVRFKRKAEVRKAAVRLPPLEAPIGIEQRPSKTSLKSKVSSKDFSQKQKSPQRVSDVDDEEALADLIAQSQQAFKPPAAISPHRDSPLPSPLQWSKPIPEPPKPAEDLTLREDEKEQKSSQNEPKELQFDSDEEESKQAGEDFPQELRKDAESPTQEQDEYEDLQEVDMRQDANPPPADQRESEGEEQYSDDPSLEVPPPALEATSAHDSEDANS